MTPASANLARRQRRWPPRYPVLRGLDRAQQLYTMLKPGLTDDIVRLFDGNIVVIGEVGRNVADIRVKRIKRVCFKPLPRPGYVIEVFSGMMEFVYAVARTLSGLMVRHTEQGAMNEPALKLESVVTEIADLFRRRAQLSKWPRNLCADRIQHPTFAISKSAHDWTEALATDAELYMVAHEIGHVALYEGSTRFSSNEEESADALGLSYFLTMIAMHPVNGLRLRIAGATFVVGIFALLQRLGVPFSEAYPPQAKRVELIEHFVRALICPSTQAFHEVYTIATNYQDILEDVGNRLDASASRPGPEYERVLVRLIAEIEEVGRGRVQIQTLLKDMDELHTKLPAPVLAAAATSLCQYYVTQPPQESYLPPDIRLKMGDVLKAAVPQMKPGLRTMFQACGPSAPAS